jgi:hypothetical protein
MNDLSEEILAKFRAHAEDVKLCVECNIPIGAGMFRAARAKLTAMLSAPEEAGPRADEAIAILKRTVELEITEPARVLKHAELQKRRDKNTKLMESWPKNQFRRPRPKPVVAKA